MPKLSGWHFLIAFVVLVLLAEVTTGVIRKAGATIAALIAVTWAWRTFQS